jgi:hypothetical protein
VEWSNHVTHGPIRWSSRSGIRFAAKIRKKKSFGARILRKCLLTQAWDSCKKAKILKPTVAHHACFFKGMFRAGDLKSRDGSRAGNVEPSSVSLMRLAARFKILSHYTGGRLMISRSWSRKSIAFCLAIAILSVYSMVVLATPGQTGPSGELSVSGQVTVNGQSAISGATVFSDSTVATAQNSSAVVSLGKLGRVELLPSSSMKVSFNETSISGMLESGRARISTPAGVMVNITTKDGSVVADGKQAAAFTIDTECGNTIVATQAGLVELRAGSKVTQVAAGQDATAGVAQPGTRCTRIANVRGFSSISGGALAALLLAAGGAIAAAILAGRNNDINFGGTVVVVSPTK